MTVKKSDLLPRFIDVWQYFVPAHPMLLPDCIGVLDAYQGPQRPYHSQTHLADVLTKLDWAQDVLGSDGTLKELDTASRQRMFARIELALFYHDVIYDAKARDNEEQSRNVFLQHAENFGMDKADSAAIARLIDITAKHTSATALDEQILTDCDLAILGADCDTFAAYDRNIRIEYAHVPAHLYDARRAGVLQHFLDEPRLFKTNAFHARYDTAARVNLRSVIKPSPLSRITRLFKR